jgi:adenylyltransferase/sulfurtransferase
MTAGSDNKTTHFSEDEWLRYTRHLQLPQIGIEGQTKLKQAHVLIVGAGGLGSPVSLYLAAAGVGRITIVDGDSVDLTNLQRQIIFEESQLGLSKALCARERLLNLNSAIEVTAVDEHLTTANAQALIEPVDLVLDCTDNFATRYLINDTCIAHCKPWIFASIYQFSGQCALFTQESGCFRCLFPENPEGVADCNTAGVLGVLPGLLGTIQATEAIKYLAGMANALNNVLLLVETTDMSFNKIQLAKSPNCPACSQDKTSDLSKDYQWQCEIPDDKTDDLEVNPEQFVSHRNEADYYVIDVRSENERKGFHIGGEHISLDRLAASVHKLPDKKEIICYCQTGIRSKEAAKILLGAGKKASSLKGGLVDYLKFKSQV